MLKLSIFLSDQSITEFSFLLFTIVKVYANEPSKNKFQPYTTIRYHSNSDICYFLPSIPLQIYPLHLIFKLLPFLQFCTPLASTLPCISRDNNPLIVDQCNCYKNIFIYMYVRTLCKLTDSFSITFPSPLWQRGLLL